jgi:hypothetical protein
MPHGAEFDHATFAQALLNLDAPPPVSIAHNGGPGPARRFRVYRNNVVSSLIEALEARFPVCLRLVGEEFFRGAATIFVRQSPPRSPILAEYGDSFPAFLEAFEAARALPYLPDVARLELAVGASYHATDAASLNPSELATIAPESLGDAVFSLHPSLRLLTSSYPIVSIWRMNVARDDRTIFLESAEDAMVVRSKHKVVVSVLPEGGYCLLRRLARGEALSAAASGALADCGALDLAGVLEQLISHHALVGVNELRQVAVKKRG